MDLITSLIPPESKQNLNSSNNNDNNNNENKRKNRAKIHLIAGALSRVTESTIMFPLDTIKTRIQFQGGNSNQLIRTKYRGILNAFVSTIRSEGIVNLYRGFFPHLLYVIPSASISFVCYEEIAKHYRKTSKSVSNNTSSRDTNLFPYDDNSSSSSNNNNRVDDRDRHNNIALPLIGMSLARLSGSIIRTPFDIIKMRMQVSGNLKRDETGGSSAREQMKRIIEREGVKGLFKYSYVSVLRDLPFTFFYFSSYEVMRNYVRKRLKEPGNRNRELNKLGYVVIGGMAGAIGTIPTIPIDVIKTKLQTDDALPRKYRFSGVYTAIIGIFKEEGLRGFTKGLGTRLVHIIPSAGISFASYEFFKDILKNS